VIGTVDARVVIIGAGIVGCSLADQLTQLGCRHVIVLEQGPLFVTGGSTSHAPGLVFQTNVSKTMTDFARCTVQRYNELERDGEPCFYAVGSIEVAATPERWADLKRKRGLAASWGIEGVLLTPQECVDKIPLLDPKKIYGGFFVPTDGIAKATRAAEAMARAAIARGARFHGETEVTAIEVASGRVRAVTTTAGRFEADIVVSCAGIWGPRIGRMVGISIPLVPMEHQYVWTTSVPELAGERAEVVQPILRHQDRSMYFRQQRDRYGIGSYQHRPMPISPDDLRPYKREAAMPSVKPFTPADFEPTWAEACNLLPALRNTRIAEAINGIFSFTPDGFPLLGESREVRGFWVAEAVWITHAVGVAKAVAEWIVEGAPSIDVRQCSIHRFEEFAHSPSYVLQRSSQSFREVYDIIHPLQSMEEPRPLRVSPFYQRQRELGAYFLEAAGWERPQWYEVNAPLVAGRPIPPRTGWAARYWSPIVGAEHLVTRERVALYDMTSLKKLEISGPGALTYLQWLTTGNIDKPVGTITYTLLLDHKGGIRSDITVARLGPNRFQVGCNGPLDVDWFLRHLPADNSVQVRDITTGTCCIGLWGPRARELVQELSTADFSEKGHKFFHAKEVFIGEVPVLALRLSYVGELGWELYTPAAYGLRLWDLLWKAGQDYGVIAGGRGAFDSLRLEKGYRMYGRDMWTEHDPYEAGLGFTVNLDKGDFLGKEALLRRKAQGPRRQLTCLTLEDPVSVVMGGEPVYAGERTPLHIEYFGERLAATVAKEPLFDPDMERMRSRPQRMALAT
jgi:glycine cleavage system aminomethyltransferase T/glycine/D-amino acid oxidase-like deaminating enzyme